MRRAPGRQPSTMAAIDDEEHDLEDLDDEDRADLGRQQAATRQRRAAEPLEDAVTALVGGGDPEVDEARGDDRQGQRPRRAGSPPGGPPPVGSTGTEAKNSRTATGMTIVTSTFSPRRAVSRSSIPVWATGRGQEAMPAWLTSASSRSEPTRSR